MSVGLIVAIGVILLAVLGLLFLYLDRRAQRKQRLREKQEETRQEEAQARAKLFEDEDLSSSLDRELDKERE